MKFTYFIALVCLITFLTFVHIQMTKDKIAVLEEIAYSTEQISITMMDLKDEVMIDLTQHLPNWAWENK